MIRLKNTYKLYCNYLMKCFPDTLLLNLYPLGAMNNIFLKTNILNV